MIPEYRFGTGTPYMDVCAHQEQLIAGGREALNLCEHPPTITLGAASEPEDLVHSRVVYERMGVEVRSVPRGGRATYHGPGQLVVYPVVNLRARGVTLHAYLRMLEDMTMDVCREYGITARRVQDRTGVWVGDRKIGFAGVRVRRGFAYHGVSLNVRPQTEAFRLIVPCGMPRLALASLSEETGREVDVWDAADAFAGVFHEYFEDGEPGDDSENAAHTPDNRAERL